MTPETTPPTEPAPTEPTPTEPEPTEPTPEEPSAPSGADKQASYEADRERLRREHEEGGAA
jgi:hypothetical protein